MKTCPKCGRPVPFGDSGVVLQDVHLWCWKRDDDTCRSASAAYERGRRDGIDESREALAEVRAELDTAMSIVAMLNDALVPTEQERDAALEHVAMLQAGWDEAMHVIECLKAEIDASEQLRLALRNVRALAASRIRKTDPENAAHLLRFCEEAGIVPDLLRGSTR